MPLINSRYTYLLSLEYIAVTTTKARIKTLLDDYKFPNLRRGGYFKNRNTNLFKATSRVKREAKIAIKNIFAELYDSAKNSERRMVTVLIAPKDLCPISENLFSHHWLFTDYFRLNDLMKDLRMALKQWHCTDYADSIECTQQDLSAYIHNHLLFGTGTTADVATIGAVLNAIANKYGYAVELQPLLNRKHEPVIISKNNSYSDDNYQTVARFVQYIYKQYKLPIAYGSKNKARAAYKRFMALTKPEQQLFIEAIENSTRSIRLRHHVSYRRYVKHYRHEAIRNLAGIYFILHEFSVTASTSLFNDTYTDKPQNARRVSHHYTSDEQWQRASKEARFKAQYAIIHVEILTAVFLYELNKLINERQNIIKIIERNKIKQSYIPTTLLSRSTGIPP